MSRKLFAAALVLLMGLSSVAAVSGAKTEEGRAGARDVILIHDVDELQNMSLDMNASYALANDIDASATRNWNGGRGFLPIADNSVVVHPSHWSYEYQCWVGVFNGELDGQGHSISNLYINRTDAEVSDEFVGLFLVLNTSSKVSNLTLESVEFSGGDMIGGVAAFAVDSSIVNCHVSGSAASFGQNAGYVGLVAGLNRGTISRCSSEGRVEGRWSVGGLVGASDTSGGGWPNVLVSDSFSHAMVRSDDLDITYDTGGLAGMNSGTILDCYSTGAVAGNGGGGLVGFSNGTVTDSFWDTESSGVATSGGGTGKTTAEMKKEGTYTGWDFTNVWQIDEDSAYPTLRDVPAENRTPTITTAPPTTATVGSLYSVQFAAADPDGDALSWNMTSNASWLSMTAGGLLSGTPSVTDLGTFVVAITVIDGKGGTASITYELTVSEGQQQHEPAWSSVPSNTTLVEGADFRFAAQATDADAGDVLVYGLTTSPACGLTMNAATGALEWLNITTGEYICVLTATDGHSVISHVFGLKVTEKTAPPPVNRAPEIVAFSAPENRTVKSSETITISADATDRDGDNLTYEWKDNGATVSTEKTFSRKFAPGNHTLILLIGDGRSTTTRTFSFTVAQPPRTIDAGPVPVPGFEAGMAAAAVVSVMAIGLFWRRERR
jgi:hypothetical protein